MKSDTKKKPAKLKKLHSVTSGIWRYFCLLALILVLLVEFIFYFVVMSTLENQAKSSLERVSYNALALIREAEVLGFNVQFNADILRYADEGVMVYILSEDGAIIFPVDNAGETFSDDDRFTDTEEYLEDMNENVFVNYASGNYLCRSAKITISGKKCYLLVSYSMSVLRSTVSSIQVYLLVVGLVMLLLAFGIAYSMSQKLSSGFKSISDGAVRLAKGDYSVKFTNLDYKELAQLSDTLNYVRDEVKKSGDFQREILANVTHDLKTPLTMIKAYASMIQEISGDDPEKRNKHLQVIIDETDRLTALVDDVLKVSKVSSNIDEITPKVFNLTDFLYGIIAKFDYLQEMQGYIFMIDIDPNLYTRADEEKIGQVIYNLLGNAVNYTGDDKTVYISLKLDLERGRIKFSVRDTGKGIKKEDLPYIWDRYYKVKENHVRPVKSTGLGLNIVKAILTNHGFDFGVESTQGKGSTFWVDFPVVPAEVEISK